MADDGSPVSGCDIRYSPTGWLGPRPGTGLPPGPGKLPEGTAKSDEHGIARLRLTIPSVSDFQIGDLRLRHPGYSDRRITRVVCIAGSERDLGDLPLSRGHAVKGRVVDEHGIPIQGARVWAASYPGLARRGVFGVRRPAVAPNHAVATDANGEFILANVGTGTIVVEARADALAGEPLVLDVPSPLRAEITLKPSANVSLTVRDGKQIVAGANVFIRSSDAGFLTGTTDESGSVTIPGLGGQFAANAEDPATGRVGGIQGLARTGQSESFLLKLHAPETSGATLAGVVVDSETGKPVPDFVAVITNAIRWGKRGQARRFESTDGRFRFSNLQLGSYSLWFRARGRGVSSLSDVKLGNGEERSDLRVTLKRDEIRVLGHVVRASDGSPVQGVLVWPFWKDQPAGKERSFSLIGPQRTDASGRFELTHLDEPPTCLFVDGSEVGLLRAEWRIPAGADLQDLNVAVGAAGAVLGVVRRWDHLPAPRLDVVVSQGRQRWTTVSDELGEFEIAGLPPGDYRLRISDHGTPVMAEPRLLEVAPNHPARVVVTVPRPSSLEGVATVNGQPAQGKVVRLLHTEGESFVTWTDDQGRFELIGLLPGRYQVTLEGPNTVAIPLGIVQIRDGEQMQQQFQGNAQLLTVRLIRDNGEAVGQGTSVFFRRPPDERVQGHASVGVDGSVVILTADSGVLQVACRPAGGSDSQTFGVGTIRLPIQGGSVQVELRTP